jgi:NodT family efflux transporter outer membrane factor (OMF) lipoprotein
MARACLGAAALVLSGGVVVPHYQVPDPTVEPPPGKYKELPANFKDSPGWKVARPQDAMLRGEWWKVFNDPELNSLEDQLNINNQNIKQFFENFMEARALVGEANAQLYPSLTANGSATRSQTGVATPATALMTSLNLTWEPDLWGKVRNAVRSAQYNAQLSAALLENERLTEQTSLAVFYFQIRGQDALQKLFNDTVVADKKALDYTQAQFDTGISDKISVVEAQNTLQNVQAAATNIGLARAQYEHAIAVLVGKVASTFSIPVKSLKQTPPSIPMGMPSQLLERRPDIAGAERTMASANAQIGIAYAAFFPSVTLGSELSYQNGKLGHLFDEPNRFWSVGPTVSQPIFDAGLRASTVRQFVATYNADLAAYRQNVLTAFQQVEDNMAQVRILSKQLIQQRAAEESAKTYVSLEMDRYKTGIDPYVDVVTAQTTLLTDQQAVISVQTQAMVGAVQLIEALGGGWDRSQLPSPADVSKHPTQEESAIQH